MDRPRMETIAPISTVSQGTQNGMDDYLIIERIECIVI